MTLKNEPHLVLQTVVAIEEDELLQFRKEREQKAGRSLLAKGLGRFDKA